jgi:integrase/recombinase XerD
MTALAPTVQAFFTDRLMAERQVSPHTLAAYRDAIRLLLGFVAQRTGKAPSTLEFVDVDASMVSAFLGYLERDRGNSPRTRNVRLAALHSLFRYAALHHPEHAELIRRVLAIPPKRFDRADISFLAPAEVDALLAAPDRACWVGRRDHALLLLAIQTGLRVSELVGLRCEDVELRKGAHVRCLGKGRKERCTPLTSRTVEVLRSWLAERRGAGNDPLFPTSRGHTLSRDAIALVVARHTATATKTCTTLRAKTVSPHVLRHTAAMRLLHAGVDTSTIALWLGHERAETTQMYVHADQTLKEKAIAKTAPIGNTPGRFRPSDSLLAFLEQLG